jgi:hypothetical protein
MTEDSGTFKTNPANSRRVPAFVMIPACRCREASPGGKRCPDVNHIHRADFLANTTNTLQYPRISLIRYAPPVPPRWERGNFVITAFSLTQGLRKKYAAKAELASMLPGLRFLFAAIVLSMSILVFGLGAAALLRAAHEEFASTPSWHASPEPVFAQRTETPAPVLAMLRVEPPAAEEKALDQPPAAVTAAEQPAAGDIPVEPDVAATPPEPEVTAKPVELEAAATPAEPDVPAGPPESEWTAAPQPDDSSQPETAKPAIPVAESPAQQEAAPAQIVAPAATDETKVAASTPPAAASEEVSAPATDAAPAASEEADPPVSAEADIASTKIATLGGPPVTIETPPPVKIAVAKHGKSPIKKRAEARRKTRHRRMALRARILQQSPQPTDPFGQPFAAVRRR